MSSLFTSLLLAVAQAQRSDFVQVENEMIMLQAFDWPSISDGKRPAFINSLVAQMDDVIASGTFC
jgi:hypothetical protein